MIVCIGILLYVPLWLYTGNITLKQLAVGNDASRIMPLDGSDALEYKTLALNLLHNHTFSLNSGDVETFRTPGYPLFVAAVMSFVDSLQAVILLQIMFVIFSVCVLFLLLKDYVSEWLAGTVAILYLVDITTVTHSLLLMSDTLFVDLLVCSFYVAFARNSWNTSSNHTRALCSMFLAGLLLGAAVLVRPVAMFLPLFIVPVYILYVRGNHASWNSRSIGRQLIAYCVGFLLIITPWMWRNYVATGVFSLSSLSTYNLFHYNLPEYKAVKEGITAPQARVYSEAQLSPDARMHQRSLTYSSELDAVTKTYLKDHFLGYIAFHILKTSPFFVTSGLKTAITIHNNFFSDDSDFPIVTENVSTLFLKGAFVSAFAALRANPYTFVDQLWWIGICALSLYGAIRRRKQRITWCCVAFILYFALLTGPVSYSRYRLPAEPFMFILAVMGAASLYQDSRNVILGHMLSKVYKLFDTMLVRYLVAGGISAMVLIGGLYILHGLFDLWYVAASSLSFLVAVVVSFLLQKYWTFQDRVADVARRQFVYYLLIALINLAINAGLMYFFVDLCHVWYLLSQVLSAGIVAVWSFFVYKHLIFKKPNL